MIRPFRMKLTRFIRTLDMSYKKALVVSALLLAIGTMVYFFYEVSLKDSISSIMNMRQELNFKKQLTQIKEKNYENARENEDFLQMHHADPGMGGHLIPDKLIAEALVNSSRLMAECSLTELEMVIGEEETIEADILDDGEEIYKVPFKISGIGAYEQAIVYMERLADGDFFYEMEGIRISSKDVAEKGHVILELQLSVYGFKEQCETVKEEWPAREGNPFYYE